MKHLFIVNPISGGKDHTEEVRAAATEALGEGGFELYVTKGPLDATEEAKRRGESGEEYRIYSCGGDGTFNECVNGACGFSNLAVAPFPLGTGNDFCRMFGDEAQLYRDLGALTKGTTTKIDVIDCNGRKCDCICSVGIDARVGCSVHDYPSWLGSAAYVVALIVELAHGLNTEMKITCGDFTAEGKFMLCCICNGRHYGGGFQPSLNAMPNDGDLDIYAVKKMSLPQIIANIGKYANGRSDEVPQYVYHLHGDSIKLELKEDTVINLDGEAIKAKTADIKLLHHALNLIVPAGMKFFD